MAKNTRVVFTFKTVKDDKILDDISNFKQPMELVLGKEFLLPAWEENLKFMIKNDLKSHSFSSETNYRDYVKVAKTLRDRENPTSANNSQNHGQGHGHGHQHMCVMSMMGKNGLIKKETSGYDDLDDFTDSCPKDKLTTNLNFTFNITSVQNQGDYQPELWQVSDQNEREKMIQQAHTKGNQFFKNKEFALAKKEYQTAATIYNQLKLETIPNSPECQEIIKKSTAIILNFCQCCLSLKDDIKAVIESCDELTEVNKITDNPKVYYKRAKAHVLLLNEEEALRDIEKMTDLDQNLKSIGQKLKDELKMACRKRDQVFKERIKF